MEKMIVVCPNCGANIDLTKAVQQDLMRSLKEEAVEELQKTQSLEMDDLRQQLKEKTSQLSEAQKNELELRHKQRDLDEKIENQELELQRRLDEERKQIVSETREKIEGDYIFKLEEKEAQLQRVIAELDLAKNKAQQGSQQLQGEVAELNLEERLRKDFPFDLIAPVGKGVRGADIHQNVRTPDGQLCGIIIWESKNTKNWNDQWLLKLKDDLVDAKADIGVIVSKDLPSDMTDFKYTSGIWITNFSHALDLANVLREIIIQVAKARRSVVGKDEKIELLYRYLSGPQFKQRVEMIVDTFLTMKSDLDKERLAITKQWGKREKCIEDVKENIVYMYGELEAIIGAALPTISELQLTEEVE